MDADDDNNDDDDAILSSQDSGKLKGYLRNHLIVRTFLYLAFCDFELSLNRNEVFF